MKTFYITYYANKHKKHITRQGKHDEKSRFGVAKNGVAYYVYYDMDAHGYRTASGLGVKIFFTTDAANDA